MHLSDLNAVHDIEQSNYPVPWSKGVLKSCIKADYHCVVVKQLDTIIGYAFLMTAHDESHLLNMCIDNRQQGNGYGRRLLRYLQNICIYNQSRSFLLEVRESNVVAQRLYRSFGFEQIGVRENYYRCVQGREHALVMSKNLQHTDIN